MSEEKNKKESLRWYRTGLEDMKAAEILEKEALYARSCFHYHQAGEKFLKAVWYFLGEEPWGHSLVKLIEELPIPQAYEAFVPLRDEARDLDKYYIPTRYPNGIPEETPEVFYAKKDAEAAKRAAQKLLRTTQKVLEMNT